jgi:DNA-binding protein YbaB
MPSEDVRRELDDRIRQLTAVIGRTPASVQELLDITFTGTSGAKTVSVTLDFRGTLRGVRIADGTLIPGDERALEAAIMEAHANATASMATALTQTPAVTDPHRSPRGRARHRPPVATEDVEEPPNILQTRY